jgi:hypothetical protein
MKFCLDVNPNDERRIVITRECHKEQRNQYFRYDINSLQIHHGPHSRHDCVEADVGTQNVFVAKCNATKSSQKWRWGLVNEKNVRSWLRYGEKIRDEQEVLDLKGMGL